MLQHEIGIRLGAFFGVFLLVALAERLWPRRVLLRPVAARWANNLGIVALNNVIARLVLPMAPVAYAAWLHDTGVGLLPALGLRGWMATLVAVVLLDLAIYLQHVMFHAVPTLWALHRMHHADVDYDVTTGARFHPLEILLSFGSKLGVITALGASPLAVLIFEVVLNGMAMFNHGNLFLPAWLDGALRLFVVTPDMHRVHHSVVPAETHSNYGFNLSVWDRWFGTYVPEPAAGQEGMQIGLPCFRDPAEVRLDRMLTLPFRRAPCTWLGAPARTAGPQDVAPRAA